MDKPILKNNSSSQSINLNHNMTNHSNNLNQANIIMGNHLNHSNSNLGNHSLLSQSHQSHGMGNMNTNGNQTAPTSASGSGSNSGGSTANNSTIVPFILKLETILSDSDQDSFVWSSLGDTILITDQQHFSKVVLPLHFRHNQLSSFIRQLNKHGFKRIKNSSNAGNGSDDQPILEYCHPFFTKHGKSQWHLIRWNTQNHSTTNSMPSPDISSPAVSLRIDALVEQNDYVFKQVENAENRLKSMEATLSSFNQRIAKQALLIDKLTQILNRAHHSKSNSASMNASNMNSINANHLNNMNSINSNDMSNMNSIHSNDMNSNNMNSIHSNDMNSINSNDMNSINSNNMNSINSNNMNSIHSNNMNNRNNIHSNNMTNRNSINSNNMNNMNMNGNNMNSNNMNMNGNNTDLNHFHQPFSNSSMLPQMQHSHKRPLDESEGQTSSMRSFEQEFESFQPDTTFITISANNTLPEYPTGSMPELMQGSMSPNKFRNISQEDSKDQERYERSSTDSSNLTQNAQTILLLSSTGFNYHLITEQLKLLNIGYTETFTVKSLLETLAHADESTYNAILFDGALINADSLAPHVRRINTSIGLVCLADLISQVPPTPTDYQFGKNMVEFVSNPPTIASLANAIKRSVNQKSEILQLSSIYHKHTFRSHGEKKHGNPPTSEPPSNLSFVYRLHTKPNLLQELSELSKKLDTGPVIPTPEKVAQKVEEIKAIPFEESDVYVFRVKYLVTQLHHQISRYVLNHRREKKKMSGLEEGGEERVRMQLEMDREKIFRAGLQITYLENVISQLCLKANTQRSLYYRELNELKREIQELTRSSLGSGRNHQPPSLLELHESFITPVEEKIYQALLKNEQIKTEQLLKWVENLKVQLRIERMREQDPIPTLPSKERKVDQKTVVANSQSQDSTFRSEDQELIKELLEKVKFLSNQVNLTNIPKPTMIAQPDVKLEAQVESLEKQVETLHLKISDMSRENLMIDSRNRELQQKYDELERMAQEKVNHQVEIIQSLEKQLKNASMVKPERIVVKEIVGVEKPALTDSDEMNDMKKRIAEYEEQSRLLQTKITEQQTEIETLRDRLGEEVKKGKQMQEEMKKVKLQLVEEIQKGMKVQESAQVSPKKEKMVPALPQATVPRPKEEVKQQVYEAKTVKVKEAWKKDEAVAEKSAKDQVKPKLLVKQVEKKPKAFLSRVFIKHEVNEFVESKETSEKVEHAVKIEMKPSVTAFVVRPRPELARISNKKPLFRSKSLDQLSREKVSADSRMKRSQSLPLLIPIRYIKGDKLFRIWTKEYAKEREKISERVSRRWIRLVKRLLDRVERQRQNAQERGTKYFAIAINQLALPPHPTQNTRKKPIRNVFQRLQSISLSSRKKEALEKVRQTREKEFMEKEKSTRWVFEEPSGHFFKH